MNHEAARELLPDLALDLLEPGDAAAVSRHTTGCATCAAELAEYRSTGEALSLGYEQVELPEGLTERMSGGVASRIEALTVPGERRDLLPLSREPVSFAGWRGLALGAAAAALLLAVGLTGALVAWSDARSERDGARSALAARSIELRLSGSGGAGVIFVASDFAGGVARFSGLSPAPPGLHYEVWSDGPGGPVRAASFGASGGETLVTLPPLPREMTRMFVTVEPDGAVAARPSGEPVLATGQ